MKHAALVLSCLAGSLLFGCGQGGKSESAVLDDIWRAYTNHRGNAGQGTEWIEVKGKLVKNGTVPPSAMNSSAEGRLPAYLACYDFVAVMRGMGDTKSDLCIYYVENPSRGTHGVMWRGKKYADQLESKMLSDGFTSN